MVQKKIYIQEHACIFVCIEGVVNGEREGRKNDKSDVAKCQEW